MYCELYIFTLSKQTNKQTQNLKKIKMKKLVLSIIAVLVLFIAPAQQIAVNSYSSQFGNEPKPLTTSLAKNVNNALMEPRDKFDDAQQSMKVKRIVFGTIFVGLVVVFLKNYFKVAKDNKQ